MMRRYGVLFLLSLVAATIVALLARGPRSVAPLPSAAVETVVPVTLEISSRGLVASTTSIPAGVRVALEVANRGTTPVRLRLAGYEDRVDSAPIAPGGVYEVTFLADRPGERFAWLLGDEPRGRLDVVGSHLVEGHR